MHPAEPGCACGHQKEKKKKAHHTHLCLFSLYLEALSPYVMPTYMQVHLILVLPLRSTQGAIQSWHFWKRQHWYLTGILSWRCVEMYPIRSRKGELVHRNHFPLLGKLRWGDRHFPRSVGTGRKSRGIAPSVVWEKVNINEMYGKSVSDVKARVSSSHRQLLPRMMDGWNIWSALLKMLRDEKMSWALIKIQASSLINQCHDICCIGKYVSAHFSSLFH